MEEQIREIVRQELDRNKKGNEYNVSPTSFHVHNGVDSKRIMQKDIVNGVTSIVGLQSLTSETFTIETTENVNTLTLYGIAANNAGGGGATKKAVLNGGANVGNCFIYKSTNGASVPNVPVQGSQAEYIQASSSIYIDTADLTHTKVNATGSTNSGAYIIYVVDETSTVVASAQIISWSGSAITIKTTLATGWQVTYFLSMS